MFPNCPALDTKILENVDRILDVYKLASTSKNLDILAETDDRIGKTLKQSFVILSLYNFLNFSL